MFVLTGATRDISRRGTAAWIGVGATGRGDGSAHVSAHATREPFYFAI